MDFSSNEDAGIYQLNEDLALVQTADFITPVVDDPYIYGQIAAANSLSDIYAMGGEVKCALNLVMWDSCNLPKEILEEILQGGLSKIKEAGGVLLGGHTISDKEQKYGLSVSGIVHPKKFWRNNTAQIGDVIILTKPIGLGVLTTALKANLLPKNEIDKISKIMATLNQKATLIAKNYTIHACTDITGFGLLGHLYEMCNKNISLKIDSSKIPLIQSALNFAKDGIIPGGSYANKESLSKFVDFKLQKDSKFLNLEILLFDAQTSGGLAFALPQKEAQNFLKDLHNNGIEEANIIAEVLPISTLPLCVI
ncbi:selenide, water dikinase SelD [Helicobacter burdigaliensis]